MILFASCCVLMEAIAFGQPVGAARSSITGSWSGSFGMLREIP
jgi:hypothetical protein